MKLTEKFKTYYNLASIDERRNIRSVTFALFETKVISEKQYSQFRDFFYQ